MTSDRTIDYLERMVNQIWIQGRKAAVSFVVGLGLVFSTAATQAAQDDSVERKSPPPADALCFLELEGLGGSKNPMDLEMTTILIGDLLEFASKPTESEPAVEVTLDVVDRLAAAYSKEPEYFTVQAFAAEFVSSVRDRARSEGLAPDSRDVLRVETENEQVRIRLLRPR